MILQYLREKGIECTRERNQSGYITITSSHTLNLEFSILIKGYIPHSSNFTELPLFMLCDRSKFGQLAHVGWKQGEKDEGNICAGSTDNLSLNFGKPELLYYDALIRAVETIKPCIIDPEENNKQILKEFEAHWIWQKSEHMNRIFCVSSFKKQIQELSVKLPVSQDAGGLSRQYMAWNNTNKDFNKIYTIQSSWDDTKRKLNGKACQISIDPQIHPPLREQNIAEWWEEQLLALNGETKRKLRQFSRRNRAKEFWIICTTTVENEVIWYAIKCSSPTKEKVPLCREKISKWVMEAWAVDVHSKEQLLPRSGANLDLSSQKVCLVGCGSVGSLIANALVGAGFQNLTFIDHDIFEIQNLYRHRLDMLSVSCDKVSALKYTFEFGHPWLRITALKDKLLSDSSKKEYLEADCIIVAIGSPTEEKYFDSFLSTENSNKAIIYTWLEGHSIGGHAVLVHPDSKGCLQCAYVDPETSLPSLNSNLNFFLPNQAFGKDIGGCGNLFLPYSQIDASQTANMAAKLAIEYLTGQIKKSVKISWKGKRNHAEKAGLKLSHRYYRFQKSLQELDLYNEECHVCNK